MSSARNGAPTPAVARRILSLPTLVSFVFAGAFLVFLVFRFDVDLDAVRARLRRADLGLFLLAAAVHYTTFLFRGARWRVLLRSVRTEEERLLPAWHAGAIILMSWFANSITFFRLGDAYRAYAYAEDSGGSFSRTMGTVVSERVVDVALVFLLLLGSAAALLVLPGRHPSPLFLGLALALVAGAGVALGAMLLVRARLVRWLPRPLAAMYERFHHGTVGSLRGSQLPLVLGWGVLGWASEVGRLYLVVQALGLELALPWVVFVTLANALLTLVPVTPGGLGVVEPGVAGLLALTMPVSAAATVALVDRSISYVSIVLVGGAAFFVRQGVRGARRRREARQPQVSVEWR